MRTAAATAAVGQRATPWLLTAGVVAVGLVALLLHTDARPRLFPRLEIRSADTHFRGRILTADGTPLALSVSDEQRVYPLGHLAGQLVGFNVRRGGLVTNEGLEGIEGLMDEALAAGRDVTLTLDAKVQAFAEDALERAMARSRAMWGTVVVLARDGRVLAAANAPFFDPASPRGRPGEDPRLKNYAFRELFEPGSSVKALTAAILLNEGVVSVDETIEVPRSTRIGDRVIHDARWHAAKDWGLAEILRHSSNVGISKLALRLGEERFRHYLAGRLHLGDPYVLPGLVEGSPIRPIGDRVQMANYSFGQGFMVTALHLAAAFNALSDGYYHYPRLFQEDEARDPVPVFTNRVGPGGATADELVRAMLTANMPEHLRISGYPLAGKSGTAQIYDEEAGAYSKTEVVASYVGLVPADEPRATVVVVLYRPQVDEEDRFGIKLAAPAFREIASYLLGYLGETPR